MKAPAPDPGDVFLCDLISEQGVFVTTSWLELAGQGPRTRILQLGGGETLWRRDYGPAASRGGLAEAHAHVLAEIRAGRLP